MNCEKVDAIRIDEWKKLGYTLLRYPSKVREILTR